MVEYQVNIVYENTLIAQALRNFSEKHPACRGSRLVAIKEFKYKAYEWAADIMFLEVRSAGPVLYSKILELQEYHPGVPIIVVTSLTEKLLISKLLEKNVSGLLLMDCCTESDVLECLARVLQGQTFYCSVATRKLFNEYRTREVESEIELTEREKEILIQLANGNRNKEISHKLKISESTVKTHRRNLMRKLEAEDLLSLVRKAFSRNVIQVEDLPCCHSAKIHSLHNN